MDFERQLEGNTDFPLKTDGVESQSCNVTSEAVYKYKLRSTEIDVVL